MTEPIVINGKLLGYLRISHPWFEVTKPVKQLFLDLAIGTTLMVFVVLLCGWWLAGIAMEPVRESYQRLKQFTADASHELRNPIAVIQTNVQVALADPQPEFQRSQLEAIERITRRLGRLIEDLLSFETGHIVIRAADGNCWNYETYKDVNAVIPFLKNN